VDELKNVIQFVVIWAIGVPVPVAGLVVPPVAGLVGALVAEAVEGVAAGGVLDGVVLLLEQAVAVSTATMAPAIARPFAG
jgi:hypothetical protein